MSDYAIKIEGTATGFSAYVPELPGVIAAGDSYEETRKLIEEAIAFHLEGLQLQSGLFRDAWSSSTATFEAPHVFDLLLYDQHGAELRVGGKDTAPYRQPAIA